MAVKSSEDMYREILLKKCDPQYFLEKPADFNQSLYCFINEFLTKTCENNFLLCKCPNWEYLSEAVNFCYWCLFYKDIVTYSGNFNELRKHRKMYEIVSIFEFSLGY